MDNERCPADSLLILYIDICDSLGRDSATSSCPSRDTRSSYDWNVPQIKQYVCLLVICEMQNLMFLAELPRIVSAERALDQSNHSWWRSSHIYLNQRLEISREISTAH